MRPFSLLALSICILAGCKKDQPETPASPVPQPTAAPAASADSTAGAPAFTPPDSGSQNAAASSQEPAGPEVTKAETPAAPKADVPSGTGGGWVLQVGSRSSMASAQASVAKLKSKGFHAYISEASGSFRIRIGSFPSKAAALSYAESTLKPAGIKAFWADLKSNESSRAK